MSRRLVHLAGNPQWAREQARRALEGASQHPKAPADVGQPRGGGRRESSPRGCLAPSLALQTSTTGDFRHQPAGLGGSLEGGYSDPSDQHMRNQAQLRVLWIGEGAPAWIESRAQQDYQWILGSTQDIVIFDAHCGLDPDALAAATGALRGGGIFVLLTPEMSCWPHQPDPVLARLAPAGEMGKGGKGGGKLASTRAGSGLRFILRLAELLSTSSWVERYSEDQSLAQLTPEAQPELVKDELGCCSADQRSAVTALMRVVTGHRRRPVVLSADRGRGKSAALGIAVGELMATGRVARVVVTAPRLSAVEPVFEHALQRCSAQRLSRREVRSSSAWLAYQSPQELVDSPPDADLVIVDEAAGLPVALLTRLLREMSRIAFATTVHGYEGSGRGFDLRFRAVLDAKTPEWRLQRLETPIRWPPGDRLEAWLTDALLLDADIASVARQRVDTEVFAEHGVSVARVDRNALAKDEGRLRETFGLLVTAHYRTRPLDLFQWLDGPGIELFWALLGGQVVGVLVATYEGGLDEEVAEQIWLGRRRLRGHLLSQMLSSHAGIERAPGYRALRVLRIAVHPQLRRCRIASSLVESAREWAARAGCSLFGSSFGGTSDLVEFWHSCGLRSVALGVQRDVASGEYAVLMAQGLDEPGKEIIAEAGEGLRSKASALLGEPLRGLDPFFAMRVFAAAQGQRRSRLSAWQRRELRGFAYGQRAYATSLSALKGLAEIVLIGPGLSDGAVCGGGSGAGSGRCTAALIAKVLQNKEWSEVAELLGCHGQRASLKLLREHVALLLDRC